MMKLSKESKYTFFSLLIIPFVWIGLNHFEYLDYLKIKTLDWRIQFRGEIPQMSYTDEEETIKLPDGGEVPRVPKVMYVNFDVDTLEMDGVGERPWDRAFFRDTALALLEKGKARSLGFDFGFTPKSMSRMVPKENSYRSDMALAELVQKFPDRVVLGCLYSGVQTPYVKPTGVSAFPPLFIQGYSPESGKFHYPESPTYPLLAMTIKVMSAEWVHLLFCHTVRLMRFLDGFLCGIIWVAKLMHTTFLGANKAFYPLSSPRITRMPLI